MEVDGTMFSLHDLYNAASREFMLGNTTIEEQISFIDNQISDPFDSGDTNYFKDLKQKITTEDELDEICQRFFDRIQDMYPHLTIDVSELETRHAKLFIPVYKFFVCYIQKIMYIFIREFLYNNRNRKMLVSEFMTPKMSDYPKEQYGKKEFYVLITRLDAVVEEIFADTISLQEFIDYVERGDDTPVYIERVKEALEAGQILDRGVVNDMWKLFSRSDRFRRTMNKLEMVITKKLIMPYLEENKLLSIRMPTVEPVETDEEEDTLEDDDE